MTNFIQILRFSGLTVLILCTLLACNSVDNSKDTGLKSNDSKSFGDDSVESQEDIDKLEKAKKIFFMIPSPIETVTILKKAGANYEANDLNPVENVSNYESLKQKSLNLGVYGADLSFASIFDQTQETMFYIKSAKKLAEGIGIMEAFDEKTVARIENNIDDSDSMLTIISDSYWIADAHLKEEGRENISALIIVGGWVEGLHLACSVYKRNTQNDNIRKRILEQKYSLKHLIDLVESYNTTDNNIIEVTDDLKSLKLLYDELDVNVVKGDNRMDQNSGVMTIGGKREIIASPDQVNSIVGKVDEIRLKYIS